MPELPEVETTRRGVAPLLSGRTVSAVAVHERRLRQPVPSDLAARVTGARLEDVERRAKYLLFRFDRGTLLVHLGMSGSLRVLPRDAPRQLHDHLDIEFDGVTVLRLRDPRRFGLALWAGEAPHEHPLLKHLGPEPFDEAFDGEWLHARARGRALAVKNYIMDARTVVGVGNIYASESLFRAGIHPSRAAGRVSRARYAALAGHVRAVLGEAIAAGGTTLRDFVAEDGRPGYFRHHLSVYGRAGEACPACGAPLACRVIGQRSSFFCRRCQR